MPNRITRHSASAALELLADGVLIVRLSGPLTRDALLYFKAEILARHGPQIRAFVADYTDAAIALDGADLDAVLADDDVGSAAAMPAFMVVSPAAFAVFSGHAARMAVRGVTRQVVTRQEVAIRWARWLVRSGPVSS